MKILFGSQFYTPSIGGVQEVMRQLAEEMVKCGHQVTVATTSDPNRKFQELNGVKIVQFDVTGNGASGMSGEVRSYQDFVVKGQFDLVMVMAAQQWTFDALWPILDDLPLTKKVFIPCGFSGFYDPFFTQYFEKMPQVLEKFDQLVFHSSKYRDIDFARSQGLTNFCIIPCGASEADFLVASDPGFKERNKIFNGDFLFLTVGSFTGLKGHRQVLEAFEQMRLPEGKSATLILNGNKVSSFGDSAGGFARKVIKLLRSRGTKYLLNQLVARSFKSVDAIEKHVARVNWSQSHKRALITDLPRHELVQAFLHADLFVFASNVEYSPLVLFETAAAGTPFLSVDVGNAPEIAEWTGAGFICPSVIDAEGYTRVDANDLAEQMSALVDQQTHLIELGKKSRNIWRKNLTWAAIAKRYEQVFLNLVEEKSVSK